MKISTTKGFTLIELMVVISIISLLSSIVFSALNDARTKAKKSAIKTELRQLSNLFALEFLENGSYSNLVVNAWIPNSYTCDTIGVTGNYAIEYRRICNSIMDKLGSLSVSNNWLVGDGIVPTDGKNEFSIMVKISPASGTGGAWFCIGSSGRVYEGNYNSNGSGCYYNP